MDGPIMSGLSAAADLLVLNILTILCSLPIFTIGAALTALDESCFHIIRQEGSSVVKGYFRSFRSNFKKGSLLGLIFLAAAILLYFDYLAAQTYAPLFRVGIFAISILLLAVFEYAFALLSRYENKLSATLKNAAMLCVAYFPRTLLMLMFTIGFWLACITFLRIMGPVLLLFGISLPSYICCMLLGEVFRKLEEDQAENNTLS
ncbi:MAG: YesL family protein [Oscillospiraceae bacterium]|nr:YesL family protein [Oscillospiraceae bacterium]